VKSQALVELRKKVGSDRGAQAEAARKLRITAGHMSRIMNDERHCGLEIALRIQDLYGIDPKKWGIPARAA
jgi:plasmid maintenance system antidote protein VapI